MFSNLPYSLLLIVLIYFLDSKTVLGQGDDFYSPPSGFEDSAPGTVLKSRSIQPRLNGYFPDVVSYEAHQLLFKTSAIDGSPIAAVTTVFVPQDAQKDRMVAYDLFEDSASAKCAPSRNFNMDGSEANSLLQTGVQIVQAYMLKGWIVAVADEEGPDSAFGAGRLAGKIVLDGMRAVKSFAPVGLQEDAIIVASGYSGGTLGTGWAAGLKEKYANELNVVGWVMGGNPANMTGSFVNLDGQFGAGLIPAAIAGLAKKSAYPQLQSIIDKIATPSGKQTLDFVKNNCGRQDLREFRYKKFLTPAFSTLGDQLLYDPEIAKVLNDNLMGRNADETPKAPVFLYHSTADHVMPIQDNYALRDTWCKNGAKVQFNTYLESGHGALAIRALRDSLDFIDRAFEKRTSDTCISKTVQPTWLSLPAAIEPLFIALLNLLHRWGQDGDATFESSATESMRSTVSMKTKEATASVDSKKASVSTKSKKT